MTLKKFTLRAFEISTTNPNDDASTCLSDIVKALDSDSNIAEKRLMALDGENSVQDFLSSYDVNKSYLFGSLMRVKPGSQLSEIPESLLSSSKISQSDLKGINKNLIGIDLYYFFLTKKYLITTLKSSFPIKRLETYINWLIQNNKLYSFYPCVDSSTVNQNNKLYSFYPCVDSSTVKAKDVKEIIFSDSNDGNSFGNALKDNEEKFFFVKELPNKLLSFLGLPSNTIGEILNHGLVSSKVSLSFKKNKNKDESSYKELLSAPLKPVSEIDNVKYKTKEGKIISGREVLRTKNVEIELVEKDIISEPQLIQEMQKFAMEID